MYARMIFPLLLLPSSSGEHALSTLSLGFHSSQKSTVQFSWLLLRTPSCLPWLPPLSQLQPIYFKKGSCLLHSPSLFISLLLLWARKSPHLGWQVTRLCQGNKQNPSHSLFCGMLQRGTPGVGHFACRIVAAEQRPAHRQSEQTGCQSLYTGRRRARPNMQLRGTRKPGRERANRCSEYTPETVSRAVCNRFPSRLIQLARLPKLRRSWHLSSVAARLTVHILQWMLWQETSSWAVTTVSKEGREEKEKVLLLKKCPETLFRKSYEKFPYIFSSVLTSELLK